jgi:hypothetical protein
MDETTTCSRLAEGDSSSELSEFEDFCRLANRY